MSAKSSLSLFAAATLLAMGAAALGADDTASLGQTLNGESCRLSAGVILCGDVPAGTLRGSQLAADPPSDPAARRAAVPAHARALPGGLAPPQDLAFDAPQGVGDSALHLCGPRTHG